MGLTGASVRAIAKGVEVDGAESDMSAGGRIKGNERVVGDAEYRSQTVRIRYRTPAKLYRFPVRMYPFHDRLGQRDWSCTRFQGFFRLTSAVFRYEPVSFSYREGCFRYRG